MSHVNLKNVSKTYKGALKRSDFTAVENVSFSIPSGAFCVLVGPSGCGKSTLLRMVAGLEEISAGEIEINEKIVNDIEPMDRDIAFVFQNYALYPHMNVYDNMAYGLRNRKFNKEEIETRVQNAAKILELDALLQRKPRELSGGQRQRVAMGRAIVRKPQVFLFDEPLSNLDAKLRVSMRIEIKKLQRSLNVTSIYVTHDQLEAMTLADILVVMNKGKIEQIGAPLEIYQKPQTLFAATFIGAPPMNIINESGKLKGFRPEHIKLGEGDNSFTFTPQIIEPIGSESYIYGIDEMHNSITLRLSESDDLKINTPFICHIEPKNIHYFDAMIHKRIDA